MSIQCSHMHRFPTIIISFGPKKSPIETMHYNIRCILLQAHFPASVVQNTQSEPSIFPEWSIWRQNSENNMFFVDYSSATHQLSVEWKQDIFGSCSSTQQHAVLWQVHSRYHRGSVIYWFLFQLHLLSSSRWFSRCFHLLPRLPISSIFPSILCFRR